MKEIYFKNVLTEKKLKRLIGLKAYSEFKKVRDDGKDLSKNVATKIANGMKKWALKNGATHYTHWFFPLTGKYAEKQTSFIDLNSKGEVVDSFSASSLMKGETDASSFPNGGERMTFEARGYTVWDYTSPVFIKEDGANNKVMYIPTAFCSFNGIALDEKTPLLRATEFLSREAVEILHKLNYKKVCKVNANLGIEQEYFLIDKNKYLKRPDLILTGRTLFGTTGILAQESTHHYYGEIDDKISNFMHELDKELWKIGIMAKIQHNEVAPSQYEIVPVFSSCNVATDQNSMVMKVMCDVAEKHGYKILLHEKPFNNLNGSGKHNNWSISTDTGLNLLDFSKVDEDVFMLFFVSVISAIDKHYDLLRMTTACASNDLRLGGNEAPPSIISVFVGDDMFEVLNSYGSNKIKNHKTLLDLKTTMLAKLYKDNCDRNRTSPFAFTGNKFEFRMVGSSQNTALTNTVLASIVGDELKLINEQLKDCKEKELKENIKLIIKENIKKHSRIIFNGNSYDKSWVKEAEIRGLKDYKNSLMCFDVLTNNNMLVLENNKIMNKKEINLRHDIMIHRYYSSILIESKATLEIVNKNILPSILKEINYYSTISNKDLKNVMDDKISKFTSLYLNLNKKTEELKILTRKLNKESDCKTCEKIINKMSEIRKLYDENEFMFSKENIPLISYDDILY